MVFRRRNKNQPVLPDIDPADVVNNRGEVIETYHHLELPPEYAVLVGSGALTLYTMASGERLPRRARDLDILLHPDFAREISQDMTLSNGTPLAPAGNHRDERPHLVVPQSSPLPVELLTNIGSNGSPFAMTKQTASTIDGVPVASLSDIYESKSFPARIGGGAREKARMDLYDASLIREHLRQSLAQRHGPTQS